jgi:hypothetical protein
VSKPPSKSSGIPPTDPDSPAKNPARISRRVFGRDAAVAAAISISSARLIAAPRDLHSKPPTTPASEQETGVKLTPEQGRDVEAKLADIIRKYGERLSEEQRKHLRRILAYNETMLAPIRSFTLQNGDPPVTVLKLSMGKNNE